MERVYTERSVREMLAMSKLMMLYYPDNYLSGGLVSALWIRLDEDDEVYGFIKSWYLWEESENHPGGQMAPTPIENPDILEDVDFFLSIEARFMDGTDTVTFLPCLTLLKSKFCSISRIYTKHDKQGPPGGTGRDPSKNPSKFVNQGQSPYHEQPRSVRRNCKTGYPGRRYKKIDQTNFFWWRTLADQPFDLVQSVVARSRSAGPPEYGSPLEAAMWITQRSQRFCWTETPGALDFLREKNANVPLPRLSEIHRVYGRRAEELVSALYNS